MSRRYAFTVLSAVCLAVSAFALWRGLLTFQAGSYGDTNLAKVAAVLQAFSSGPTEPGHVIDRLLPLTEENLMFVFLGEALALAIVGVACGLLARRAREPSHLYAPPLVFSLLVAVYSTQLLLWAS